MLLKRFANLLSPAAAVFIILGGFNPGSAEAQQTSPEIDTWRNTITGLGCPYIDEWSLDHNAILSLTSAFAGESLVSVIQNAGYSEGDAGTVMQQGLGGFDNREAILHRILLGNERATRRMKTEAGRYSSDLCLPIVKVINTGLFEIARMQKEVRPYWQPHSAYAQSALNFKGCASLEADGLFGPASRSAWTEAGQTLSAGNLPSPGDVVAMMQSSTSCSGEDVTAIVTLVSDCNSALPDAAAYRSAMTSIQKMAAQSQEGYFSAASPHLQCMMQSLAYNEKRITEPFEFVANTIRRIEIGGSQDWGRASVIADFVLDKLLNEETSRGLNIVAQQLLTGENGTGHAGVGLAMLARMDKGVFASEIGRLVDLEFNDPELAAAKTALVRKSLSTFNELLVSLHWETGEQMLSARGPMLLDTSLGLGASRDFIVVAAEISKSEKARQILLSSDLVQLNYALGALMMEGLMPGGRDVQKAVQHFEVGATFDHAPSVYRLALMTEYGLGLSEDPDGAFEMYVKAARLGDTAAALTLAKRFEAGTGVVRDWTVATEYYRQALFGMDQVAAARAIYNSTFDLTGYWDDPNAGGAILEEIRHEPLRKLPTGDDRDWQAEQHRGQYRKLAAELGRLYADAESGQSLDLKTATEWLRISGGYTEHWRTGTEEESYDIARKETAELLLGLLRAEPEYATHSDEIAALEKDAENDWIDTTDAGHGAEKMRAECPVSPAKYEDSCTNGLRRAAIGLYGANQIPAAFDLLTEISDAELKEIEEFGRLRPDPESLTNGQGWNYNRPPDFTFQLVDVLAFYGDYEEAERRARIARGGAVLASLGPLRRQVARSIQTGEDLKGLDAFLNTVARQGSKEARDLLAVLRGQSRQTASEAGLAEARVRVENLSHLTHSLALASSARRLAPLEAEEGNLDRAIELEMIALGSDLARHGVAAAQNGPIGAALAEVCSLSKASERLFGYGAPEIALLLAKQAVNRLQQARSDLAELPERMQLCFRSQVENHYRWLADLMMTQNRPQEASRVLEMLKDFESFEFSGRARGLIGDAYDTLPFSASEQALLAALADITPPDGGLLIRRATLENLSGFRDLTAGEQAELADIEQSLFAQEEASAKALNQVLAKAETVKDEGEAPGFEGDQLMGRYLESGQHPSVAILQYVVLEDRFGLVLTSSSGQNVWTWDQMNGAAFSEAELDSLVKRFRLDVLNANSDPREAGQELHDLLLPQDVLAVLADQNIDTLVLSLDRQLRYVPMAALFDGEKWLAETFVLSHVSVGTSSDGVRPRSDLIAGFGATKSFHGLPALPAVETEVKAVVQETADDAGYILGTAHFDQDFNRSALVDALKFNTNDGPTSGVLHLASHFKIGRTESDSALLLGNGELLSVQEIREGMGQDADLSQVSLLTLSACETGFGTTDADGRELESVAAIAQHKGAEAVLASLLPVPDTATAALMVEFYRNYADDVPLARALRNAQVSVMSGAVDVSDLTDRGAVGLSTPVEVETTLAGWQHPRFWASFILLEGSL